MSFMGLLAIDFSGDHTYRLLMVLRDRGDWQGVVRLLID